MVRIKGGNGVARGRLDVDCCKGILPYQVNAWHKPNGGESLTNWVGQ